MAFPQSFSTTAECPFMENSASTVTVRLSTSCSPMPASASRFVSFSSDLEPPIRPRSHTESDVIEKISSPTPPSQPRVKPTPIRMSISASLSSTFSPRRGSASKSTLSNLNPKPELESSMSWFGRACEFMRPWEEDDDATSIPEEHKETFFQTRDAVSGTLKRMVKCTGEMALDVLVSGMEIMEFIPEPALQTLAKTFLSIWKAVQFVSMNRLAFLRLVQTCTTILDSIINEVDIAGDQVVQELSTPIAMLEKSFESLLSLVESQDGAPFLARYLKRDETAKAIASCNESLLRALALFTTAIQIRTLKVVCANSQIQDAKYNELKAAMLQAINGQPSNAQAPTDSKRNSAPVFVNTPSPAPNAFGISSSPSVISRSTEDLLPTPQIVPALQELQTVQHLHDHEADIEDLERTIKQVLKTGSDEKLLAFLGVEPAGMPEAIKTLQRTLEERSVSKDTMDKDVLHREFLECGMEAFRRLTTVEGKNLNVVQNLPAWTITQLEIFTHKRIGVGSFSQVYEGKWKNRVVAIKYLSDVTPSSLFLREMNLWKTLKHPNVLSLYGASSATDKPPWFFVSPYMENGTLVGFLKKIARRQEYEVSNLGPIAENLPCAMSRNSCGVPFLKVLKAADVYRILQEIARGMEYLHRRGILHGDLKGANVLVDTQYRCLIADFGQSEMKSEVYRITGSSMQTGTLRWKAPELLDGSGTLTPATDVYAYAITCIEVLSMGDIPWGSESDEYIRINVLERNRRPAIPMDYPSPLLHELIESCWASDPDTRPLFSQVVARLDRLKSIAGDVSDPLITYEDVPPVSPTTGSPRAASPTPTPYCDASAAFASIDDYIAIASTQEVDALQMQESATVRDIRTPEPGKYVHRTSISSTKTTSSTAYRRRGSDDARSIRTVETVGPGSPLDTDDSEGLGANERRYRLGANERRYRLYLEHDFNASLTLPLWDPSPVQIGDVGYLRKPAGAFVTLFNALKPAKLARGAAGAGAFPNLAEYGSVSRGNLRMDRRSVAQRGLDAFSGFLAFRTKNELPIVRRQAFRLRAGHRCAYMYTEGGDYLYMKRLDAPKAWFSVNADRILETYGQEHGIQKEDLLLVISLLQAPNYALFVSHSHPEGQVHFNVFAGPKKGRPWGSFTTHAAHAGADTERNGPSYEAEEGAGAAGGGGAEEEEHRHAAKVSRVGEQPRAVLLGRLRFKPDGGQPTTAK